VGSRPRPKVPTRYRRMLDDADRCRRMQDVATRHLQAFWLCARGHLVLSTAMVRKGSPVRVWQRASETALQRGFLISGAGRMTTSEQFRARRGQARPPAGAAPPLRDRGAPPALGQGTDAVPAGREALLQPPANRREAFEPIIAACAGEPALRLHGWFVTGRVVAIGSLGPSAMATATGRVLAKARARAPLSWYARHVRVSAARGSGRPVNATPRKSRVRRVWALSGGSIAPVTGQSPLLLPPRRLLLGHLAGTAATSR